MSDFKMEFHDDHSHGDYLQLVTINSENFRRPSHVCLGTTATFKITVKNDSNALHRGSLVVLDSVQGNTPYWDAVDYPSEFTLRPRCSEILKVTFTPKHVGNGSFSLVFHVRDQHFTERRVRMTIVKTLHVIVLTPKIDAKPTILDFGEIPTSCHCFFPMSLYSANEASIPVKISIEGSSSAYDSAFYFPNESHQVDDSIKASIISSNSILCRIPANLGHENRGTKIMVALKTASTTDPIDLKVETCNVRVELDSSGQNIVLANLTLKAFVGAIRLHTNVGPGPINLTAFYPSPARVKMSLTNSSKIPLAISLGCVENNANFSVSNKEMMLIPDERDDIELIFRPSNGAPVFHCCFHLHRCILAKCDSCMRFRYGQ